MPPKRGYRQPGREGKVSMLTWLEGDLRRDFKIACIERDTTMNEAVEAFVREYAAEVTKRRRKSKQAEP